MKQKGQEIIKVLNLDIGDLGRKLLHSFLRKVCVGIDSNIKAFEDILPNTRISHPISKMLRPVFQHRKIRTVLGANLAGAMILVGSVSASPGAVETFPTPEIGVLTEEVVVATTEPRFVPAVATIGLSQGYHGFHRGIDLRARIGTPIVAIAEGKVIELVRGRFGYGHYVLINHKDGFSSLYAHMSKIEVEMDEEVKQGQKLGVVGTTGWSSGSHLHLEIYENGRAVNPLSVMPVK